MNNQFNNSEERWYNKTFIVYMLIFALLPLGLYALWKYETFSKAHKIITSSVIGLLFLVAISS